MAKHYRWALLIATFAIFLQGPLARGNAILQDGDNEFNESYEDDDDDDNESRVPLRISKQAVAVDPVTNTAIQTGIGCGYYSLIPGQTVQVTSSNFGIAPYDTNDGCVWKFTSDNCLLAAKCPCFDVPASFQCLGDYLRISDSVLYSQKFCGEVAPQGAYRSVSGHLKIRFRSDFAGYAGQGFLCYVFCTEPGLADPKLSLVDNSTNCFVNSGTTPSPGGSSTPIPGTGEISIPPPPPTVRAQPTQSVIKCNPPKNSGNVVGDFVVAEKDPGCL